MNASWEKIASPLSVPLLFTFLYFTLFFSPLSSPLLLFLLGLLPTNGNLHYMLKPHVATSVVQRATLHGPITLVRGDRIILQMIGGWIYPSQDFTRITTAAQTRCHWVVFAGRDYFNVNISGLLLNTWVKVMWILITFYVSWFSFCCM